MELWDAIRKRRSIRRFASEPVPDDVLHTLIEAARLAPSAVNAQPWRFVAVRDASVRERLSHHVLQPFVCEAPLVLVCCAVPPTDDDYASGLEMLAASGALDATAKEAIEQHIRGRDASTRLISAIRDCALAIEHIVLMCVDRGLGCCPVGSFDEQGVKEVLGIPPHVRVVLLLAIGTPLEGSPPPRPRLPRERILAYERWTLE